MIGSELCSSSVTLEKIYKILKFITNRGRIRHKFDKIRLSSASVVTEILLPKVEIFESWKSRDIVLCAQRLVLRAVDGSKRYFLVICKLLSSTHVLWFRSLAVTTPRGVEHDKSMLLFLEEWLEVLLTQVGYLKHQTRDDKVILG